MKNLLVRAVNSWLPLSVGTVCIFGILFVAVQQTLRRTADDIPMQYATDVKTKLEQGKDRAALLKSAPPVDMSNNLAPVVIVYDDSGRPLAANCALGGMVPSPPAGAFATATRKAEYHVTWQPQRHVRIAAVMLSYYSGGRHMGYVLSGQSLYLTEKRVHFVGRLVVFGIIITLIATFVMTFITQFLKSRAPVLNTE